MPRKPTLTQQTNAEQLATFQGAVASLGQTVDARTARVYAIRVDGIELAERYGELRKPDSAFYEKSFIEANALAHLAVNLNLDREGQVDVLRLPEPQPDTKLTVNGATVAFVEQTMIMDQRAHRLSLDVEAVNKAVRALANPEAAATFDRGILTLRFDDIPAEFESGLPVDAIAREIVTLASTLRDEVQKIQIDFTNYHLLAQMNALGTYRLGGATYNPVMSLVDHGDARLLPGLLSERIGEKRRKAAGYPRTCRPLWLLLNIDIHFGFHAFTRQAREIVESAGQTEFDRVIVDQAYADLVIVDGEPGGPPNA